MSKLDELIQQHESMSLSIEPESQGYILRDCSEARSELAALRERIKELEANPEVICPDCDGQGGEHRYAGEDLVDSIPCELCQTRGKIDSDRVKEMRTAEIARGMAAQTREIRLEAALAKADELADVVEISRRGEGIPARLHDEVRTLEVRPMTRPSELLMERRLAAYRTAREAAK